MVQAHLRMFSLSGTVRRILELLRHQKWNLLHFLMSPTDENEIMQFIYTPIDVPHYSVFIRPLDTIGIRF